MKKIKIILTLILGFGVYFSSLAQDGEALFNNNCATCHIIGEKSIGPNLMGVHDRQSEQWIKAFINNSQKVIESKDEYAVKLFKEYNKTPMTAFEGLFTDAELDAIVGYLKVATPPPPPPPTKKDDEVKNNIPVDVPLDANSQIAIYVTMGFLIMFVIIFAVILFTLVDFIINKSDDVSKENLFVRLVYVLYGDYSILSGKMDGEVMEDHEYDGIQELDNGMPPWLAYVFYISILIAVFYLFHYQILKTGSNQIQEYEAELAEAALIYPPKSIDIKLMTADGDLNAGESVFMKNCMACHGKLGEGGVGPNLTDKYWIHGGKLENVFTTIKEGVPSKGMISWAKKLSDKQILQTASYIMKLQGTNPPNGKKAEGEMME